MFGKNIRTDIIVLLVIAAIAGPLLTLKMPGVLGMLSTVGMIALVVYFLNICFFAMPANMVLGTLTIVATCSVARLSAIAIFAPATLVSFDGILLLFVAGVWSFFAAQMATQVGSWKNNTKIGGPRR